MPAEQYQPTAMDVADPIAWLESAVARCDQLTRDAVAAFAAYEEARSAIEEECDALLGSNTDIPYVLLSYVRDCARTLGVGSEWGSGDGPGGRGWVLNQLEDLVAITGLAVRKAKDEPLVDREKSEGSGA